MARVVFTRASLIAGLIGLASALWMAPRYWAQTTDFDRELQQLSRDLAPGPAVATADGAARRAFRLYQRATLTNQPEHYRETRDAVVAALEGGGGDELTLLEAALEFREHDLVATRRSLAGIASGNTDAQLMLADVDLQDGRYDDAAEQYDAIVRRAPTWSALARVAFLTGARGDLAGADGIYAQAEDHLTAKEMRSYAWVQVQRGWLQFSRGRYAEAASYYQQAGRAYSGYWLVDEFRAELLGAEQKFAEAIATYEQVIARAPRPDLFQQLGDLYMAARRPADAAPWHDRALAGYRESAGRGEGQHFHHLAAFYSDVRIDGAEAVKWARKDLELRRGHAAVDTLAWALYRHGETAEALATVRRALALGIPDPHLFHHAATIARAAGQQEEAQRMLATLNDINPRFSDFHVHR